VTTELPFLASLAFVWAGYFALHSALATLGAKRFVAARWPDRMPAYRLAYNALSVVLLVPLLAWTVAEPGPFVWAWRGPWAWLADGAAAVAVLGFVWTLRDYDGAEFLGLRQWRHGQTRVEDQEYLHISPLHRFVRHPWYALGLLVLWTRDMDAARLVAAAVTTGYVLIGLRLEERRLVALHGDVYRRYQQRVPALVPRPWRWLNGEGAAALRGASDGGERTTRSPRCATHRGDTDQRPYGGAPK
jgi:protein-S-isoprenylcysteine O-methyltransferase Ste14